MATVRFGVFDLDLETGELQRLGRRVYLPNQAAKVLARLASRPGEVVSREELKQHLWGPGTFVDFDRGLNFCIATVRAALRDDAHSPRFIETVPRRGYRFIAETIVITPAEREPRTLPANVHATSVARRWPIAVAAAMVFATQQPVAPIAHSRATAPPAARAAFEAAVETAPQDWPAIRRSVATLQRAINIDPRFGEAHFALADTYFKLAVNRELPAGAALAEAEAAARSAIALEDMPETRQLLAAIHLTRDWDGAAARRELAHAVALAPKWDIGLASYARVLSAIGDDDGAITAINRAETLSPSCDLILFDAGAIYARAGRFAEADQKLQRAIDLGPPRALTRDRWRVEVQFRRMRFAVARGDWQRAREAAEVIVDLNGHSDEVLGKFSAQDSRTSVEAFLRRNLQHMQAEATTSYVAPTRLATLFALLGDRDSAVTWLETAAYERDPELVYALRDPEFGPLHGMPRFKALQQLVRGT